jgi:hypothetical protein
LARVLTDSELEDCATTLQRILSGINALDYRHPKFSWLEEDNYKKIKLGVLDDLKHIADVLDGSA